MKRLTPIDLENLAFSHGVDIEFDREENIAVIKIGRATYYSVLPAAIDGAA